jgi:hypothetical protein
MSPALQRFNPMNAEAKSLYLNVWAELGLVGLGIVVASGFRILQFCRAAQKSVAGGGDSTAVLFAAGVSVMAVAIAGLADTPILHYGRCPSTFALTILLGASAAIARDTGPAGVAVLRPSRTRHTASALTRAFLLICLWTAASSVALVHEAEPTMNHYVEEVLHSPIYGQNRQITDKITDTLIAAEDRNFYAHHGVDWNAERRSLSEDIRELSLAHGGSTISMQAVRYIMLPYYKTPARKIAQIVLAMRLERRLSKQQILRLYLDSVSFGLHIAGLQSAAKIYFNKRPEKLTLAESAFLVGVISHPPATVQQVTPQFIEERVEYVLAHTEQMFGDKYGAEAFDQARQEKLHFAWENIIQVGKMEAH